MKQNLIHQNSVKFSDLDDTDITESYIWISLAIQNIIVTYVM